MRDATKRALSHGHDIATFDPHVAFSSCVRIWTPSAPSSSVRVPLRVLNARGRVQDRERIAISNDTTIGTALASVPWTRILQLKYAMSRLLLLYHRVKGLRINGWARALDSVGCPHCPAAQAAAGHAFHIFWHCPSAQVVWRELRDFWTGLGLWRLPSAAVADNFEYAVFSLTLPATPPAAAFLVPSRTPDYDWATALYRVMSDLWELQAVQCLQLIWRWRHHDDPNGTRWTAAQARSVAKHTLLASVATVQRGTRLHENAALLHRILRAIPVAATRPRPTTFPAQAATYLLFFDGGSRGNPGPGGAGAVVVKISDLGAEAAVCWSAAMSLADKTTTNNYAEYVGVVTGLRCAYSQGWTPLTVIGDSHLIL